MENIDRIKMILDGLFKLFEVFNSFIMSPYLQYGLLVVGAIFIGFRYLRSSTKHLHEVLYFAEQEKTGLQLKVLSESPRLVTTEKNMRFLRNSVAYTFRIGKRMVTRYLGKRGTAYTFKLKEGKVKKVGSIYDGVVAIWGQDKVDKLKSDELKQLKDSELWITVDLEKGLTPTDYTPFSEQDIKSEANVGMANLVGKAIREELESSDYIRVLALLGAGGCAIFLLAALGIITL